MVMLPICRQIDEAESKAEVKHLISKLTHLHSCDTMTVQIESPTRGKFPNVGQSNPGWIPLFPRSNLVVEHIPNMIDPLFRQRSNHSCFIEVPVLLISLLGILSEFQQQPLIDRLVECVLVARQTITFLNCSHSRNDSHNLSESDAIIITGREWGITYFFQRL